MAENVSSNVLFHFTRTIESVKGILENGFFPRLCAEYTLDPIDKKAARNHRRPMRERPMVCFCDLPMSLIDTHLEKYGPFAIGLSKEWGLKNGLAPVTYTHANALTSNPIKRLASGVATKSPTKATNDLNFRAAYTKLYAGPEWRNRRINKRVEFYDEREWRYVPVPEFLDKADRPRLIKRNRFNRDIQKKFALQIHPTAIQYLILPNTKNENNVFELHRYISKLYTRSHSKKDAALVTTTITTVDRIKSDI